MSAAAAAAATAASTYRILNVSLPPNKGIGIALTYIYGIGPYESKRVCANLGLNPLTKVSALTPVFSSLRTHIESQYQPRHIQSKLLGQVILNKVKLGSYQGIRHALCLPVHGQKTQSNARTQRKFAKIRAREYHIPLLKRKAPTSGGGRPPQAKSAAAIAKK